MTATTSLSGFHQWLLSEPSVPSSSCAIMVHGDPGERLESIVPAIAEYLNEYDDECDGRWLAATTGLLDKIANDGGNLRLIGIGEDTGDAPAPRTRPAVVDALCRRGHIVLATPSPAFEQPAVEHIFHAGIGGSGDLVSSCHLILNPDLIDQGCLAMIIGDVFLEWINCKARERADAPPAAEDPRGI